MSNNIIYLWGAAAVIAMTCGSVCIKKSINDNNKNWFYFALLLACFLSICYSKLYNYGDMSNIYIIINIAAIIFMVCIGSIMFNETCNINKIIGLILGILAIYFLTNK